MIILLFYSLIFKRNTTGSDFYPCGTVGKRTCIIRNKNPFAAEKGLNAGSFRSLVHTDQHRLALSITLYYRMFHSFLVPFLG